MGAGPSVERSECRMVRVSNGPSVEYCNIGPSVESVRIGPSVEWSECRININRSECRKFF
jgi:hypothetical protein